MLLSNMTNVDMVALLNFHSEIADRCIAAIKKYFEENMEMIACGLSAMSGNIVIPSNRR